MNPHSNNLAPIGLPPTDWVLIASAGMEGEAQRQALTEIIVDYSPALRAILTRRFRLKPADVEDMLQGFLADRVLEKEVIARADRAMGKFRTFLLTSLEHYVVDQFRKRTREVSANEQLSPVQESAVSGDPRLINDAEWAKRVIQLTLARMKKLCEQSARMDLWLVFEGRVIGPALEGSEPIDYATMMPKTAFKTPLEAMNALATAKRMFQRILEEVVSQYIGDPSEAPTEVLELRAALAGPR